MNTVTTQPKPTFRGSDFTQYWFEYIGLPSGSFASTPYGNLNAKNPEISMKPMMATHHSQAPDYMGAKWGWVVADIRPRLEDETMCHFEAFHAVGSGSSLVHSIVGDAEFGVFVEGGIAGPMVHAGDMGIQWTPWANQIYVPYPKLMTTPETGGYRVFVADKYIPSELVQFGLIKGDANQHTGLVIKFALIPLPDDYPWGR